MDSDCVHPGARQRIAVLCCLLAVAAALRLGVALYLPHLIWADEIYQVVEPAHHLIYGSGIVAWEYVVGMRSWLFPGVIAGVLWLGHLFGSDPWFKLVPVQVFMVLCSLAPVWVAWRWGEQQDGLRGGVVAGGFAALWVDLLYISAHPLSDVIAGDVLMAALYAAFPLTANPCRRRLALAGALFGLAFVLRMQLGPALLVAAIFACGRERRDWAALIAGGLSVLLASGLLDWVTLGQPFRSIWLNLWLNIAKGVSDDYGTMPASYFLVAPILYWGVIPSLAVIAQFVIGGRRFPALAAVVIAIFLTQSLIGHKELRFIFPALPPLIALCGLAAIGEIRDISRKWTTPPNLLAGAALTVWGLVSLTAALTPAYRSHWTLRSELVRAFDLAARQPGLCAVDLADFLWLETPGSAALPEGIPIYVNRILDIERDHAGYNVAITPGNANLPSYRKLGCFAGSADMGGDFQKQACVWRRDRGCTKGVASLPRVNWPPFFTDAQGKPRRDRIQAYRLRGS